MSETPMAKRETLQLVRSYQYSISRVLRMPAVLFTIAVGILNAVSLDECLYAALLPRHEHYDSVALIERDAEAPQNAPDPTVGDRAFIFGAERFSKHTRDFRYGRRRLS